MKEKGENAHKSYPTGCDVSKYIQWESQKREIETEKGESSP
jgi:hypothetical protein